MENPARTISRLLAEGERFLITAHASPDGDALGSSAALGHLLKTLGKEIAIYNESGLPAQFDWLPLPCPVLTEVPEGEFDWVVSLDCGSRERLGKAMAARFPAEGSINIDHHLGNPEFAEVNWVDPGYAAVGEMVCMLARELDVPLAGALGEAAYLAIVTDSGFFGYGSTKPRTLELAAEILRHGLEPASFTAKLQNQWTLERLKLWSKVFDDATLHCGGTVGLMRVSRAMLDATGTTKADTDQLVNYLRRVKTVRAAILLREDGPSQTKISLRSSGGVNVQAVAAELGGGGHRNAAGCSVAAPLDEASDIVLDVAARILGCGEAHG